MNSVITSFVSEFWATIVEMSPYLLFGFLFAGFLSVLISPKTVEYHLGSKGFLSILKASLFGIPLPLCSCGVIPVSMSLYKHGASRGATISFLLSTPQTGVDSILVTYSLLGPIFAIVRPIAALLTGLLGGGLVDLLDRRHDPQQQNCSGDCCNAKPKQNRLIRALRYGLVVLPSDIGKSMLVGLVIAAVISTVVPDDFFGGTLAAGSSILAMIIMMLVGIPLYVCATASVPIAAALIAKGLNPGAAMVFLMTGPATNAAAFTTLWSTMGRKTAILYIISVIICSFATGLVLDLIFKGTAREAICQHGWMLPGWVGNVCAVILLAVLGWALINNSHKNTKQNG